MAHLRFTGRAVLDGDQQAAGGDDEPHAEVAASIAVLQAVGDQFADQKLSIIDQARHAPQPQFLGADPSAALDPTGLVVRHSRAGRPGSAHDPETQVIADPFDGDRRTHVERLHHCRRHRWPNGISGCTRAMNPK